jgi:parafibromin
MATADPLLALRASIAASKAPSFSTTSDPANAPSAITDSIPQATHLYFSYPIPQCIPLDTPTRFVSQQAGQAGPVELRSVYVAWMNKDALATDYISKVTELNQALPDGHKIRNLVFVEKGDLLAWLDGANTSEFIKPLEGNDAAAEAARKAAEVAGGAGVPTLGATGVGVTQQAAGGRPVKVIDARLQQVYNGERKMGDHNTVLRGIKPTVRILLSRSSISTN